MPWKDPLGRSTPRGTVIGFLEAARVDDYVRAAQYLNVREGRAEAVARELYLVLDARLPARFTRISDAPEGAAGERMPNREIIGTIEGARGSVSIVVERISRGDPGPIWLFSAETLKPIPALYDEIVNGRENSILPAFLTSERVGGIRLIDCLLVLALPFLYFATLPLDRMLAPLIGRLRRRVFQDPEAPIQYVLPAPARVLVVLIAGGWLVSTLPFSLTARQRWSTLASLIAAGAVAWLLILLIGEIERHIQRRIPPSQAAAATSLLRLVRRSADVLVLVGALIVMLRQLGVDPTPALAGLGVGGIAVALAAQKTLENVIAGASLIFDQAVRVGDVLKMGDVLGTVVHIGLRSTRIRTLDRTVVSVPNGQIANASLETLSSRDKFWFHPVVGLRYETTPDQLHSVVDGLRRLLDGHPLVDTESVRVRFFRLGSFSLDIDVCAYLRARDPNHFLELQEQLLFEVTEIVSRSGTSIAFPSQTMYVANASQYRPGQDAQAGPAGMLQPAAAPGFHASTAAG